MGSRTAIILLAVFASTCSDLKAQRSDAGLAWRSATIYQIYPRSFCDSDGDGIGDLKGIISKLDHIRDLGFNTIWISPFFQSPQKDFGYDVSDYRKIDPVYGDMATCSELIDAVHSKGMRILFDLVMNHTSDQHAWFKESCSSIENSRSDWYVWKDGRGNDGQRPPNNWKSMIGGSGWHYSPARKQFYWASFLPFQPDLNYSNPRVRAAMLNVAGFWLNKGVDGFRLDIFNAIAEDTSFRNNPFSLRMLPSEENPNGFFQKAKYNINQPGSFEFAVELRQKLDSFSSPQRFMVGEVFGRPQVLRKFIRYQEQDGLHTVFLFKTLSTHFSARAWRRTVQQFEENFPAPFMPTYVFSNHDRRRSMEAIGNDVRKAKLLALLQFTVRGIPFTYYGEELGMEKPILPMKTGKDPLAHRYGWIPQFMVNWSGQSLNRDECRTPMLWNGTENAGFSTASKTWLPVADNYLDINAQAQRNDSSSLLSFYHKVIALRNEMKALHSGIMSIEEDHCSSRVFAYVRSDDRDTMLVLLNFSARIIKIPDIDGQIMLSTVPRPKVGKLQPFEGRVLRQMPEVN